jgi:hypothetical protein
VHESILAALRAFDEAPPGAQSRNQADEEDEDEYSCNDDPLYYHPSYFEARDREKNELDDLIKQWTCA